MAFGANIRLYNTTSRLITSYEASTIVKDLPEVFEKNSECQYTLCFYIFRLGFVKRREETSSSRQKRS